jgi:hypothetical protein
VPEAVTRAENPEMTGNQLLFQIRKKVREEFENVSDKIKNADYDKYGNQIKTGSRKNRSSFEIYPLVLRSLLNRCDFNHERAYQH